MKLPEKQIIEITNEVVINMIHEMYFQEYCGCIYSYNAYKEKKK